MEVTSPQVPAALFFVDLALAPDRGNAPDKWPSAASFQGGRDVRHARSIPTIPRFPNELPADALLARWGTRLARVKDPGGPRTAGVVPACVLLEG